MGRTKALFLAYQTELCSPLIQQFEVGFWADNSGIAGRKSSALLGYSVGVHANAGSLFAQALVGPSVITATDSNLGGPLQFNNDIGFGLRDQDSKGTVGIAYKHVSSAGIFLPNKGRDLIMFRVSLPW